MKILQKIIRKFLNTLGFDIIRSSSSTESNLNLNEILNYELEDQATNLISIIKGNTMLSKRRLVTLYQQVAYCEKNKILGSFVECGVWKGGAIGLMALGNIQLSSKRRNLHLFDSFEEICEPDPEKDGQKALNDVKHFTKNNSQSKGRLRPVKGIYDEFGGPGSLEENKNLLENIINYPSKSIFYHKGWFQETLPISCKKIDKIAILRLDGDWYSSTKVCLEYLFNKVAKGGVVIIDDYGTYDGCRKAVDEFLKKNKVKYYLASVDKDCRFLIKQ
ncbi:TylF/MycF family methyltransferase [Methylophilaceae bacterium]|nr:TylF/MycF family methyltransferase [Methylophilaceae bacterium]